jgi:hypothetical protein
MIYHTTKFHVPGSTGSLVITNKLKTKYRFHAATIFFIFYKKDYLNRHCIFFDDLQGFPRFIQKGIFIMEKPLDSSNMQNMDKSREFCLEWLAAGHIHGDYNPTYTELHGFVHKPYWCLACAMSSRGSSMQKISITAALWL